MKRPTIIVQSVLAASLSLLLPVATPVAAQAPMVMETLGPVSYICGGVGADEQQALDSKKAGFNMDLLFTQGARGEYLSDVEIRLSRDGQQVASFRAPGPRCLIKAPAGTYTVEATSQGAVQRAKLSTRSGTHQFRW